MDDTFAIALASLHQDLGRIDRVAQNLVNAATPGYKRDVAAARPFAEVVEGMKGATGIQNPRPETFAAGLASSLVDVKPGTLKITGEPLDLAITGDGFFEIKTEAGFAYTRQGNFRLDPAGHLVTADGHAVMGKDGEIRLTSQTPVIDATGAITDQDGANNPDGPIAQIKVVRFPDTKSLQRLSGGLLQGSGATPVGESESQLRQGALENSNVNSAHEMVQMIEAARHFESMQKVVQGYDEMIGSAIHKLGDLS